MPEPPDRSLLDALHEHLLRGAPLASQELVRRLLLPLLEEIGRRFPRADEQLVFDGVIDALLH